HLWSGVLAPGYLLADLYAIDLYGLYHIVHRGFWEGVLRLVLSADLVHGDGFPQGGILDRRRCQPATEVERHALEQGKDPEEDGQDGHFLLHIFIDRTYGHGLPDRNRIHLRNCLPTSDGKLGRIYWAAYLFRYLSLYFLMVP